MGREVRRVPPNWEHPRFTAESILRERFPDRSCIGKYMPLYDETFEDAAREWKEGLAEWERGEHRCYTPDCEYWEGWGSPPDREFYRPAFVEEPTWFQVYETVSEGTPVTPPFETPDELIEWLVTKGENFGERWQQKLSRAAAIALVREAWAPSMVIENGEVKTGAEALVK